MSNHGRDELWNNFEVEENDDNCCPECGHDGSNVDPEQFIEWQDGLPTQAGEYWFWGYRYSRQFDKEKSLGLLRVHLNGAGHPMYIYEGTLMFKGEVTESMFRIALLPKPPEE